MPNKPLLSRHDTIIAQGSCFAANVHEALTDAGVRSVHFGFMEILNSPWSNHVFLDYALEGAPFRTENHKRFYQANADIGAQIKTAAALIFTVGVGWSPVIDDEVLLGFDEDELSRLTWRLTSVRENVAHLTESIRLVKRANPTIRIVLTVSPIPIKNAFGGQSAVVADCASKSILRAAVQEVLDGQDVQDVTYWPSFEAIRWLSGHTGQVFGTEDENHRHPGKSYIRAITDEFVAAYFKG